MNARGHRALDSQCTQVDAFGASRLRSLQCIDEGEEVASNLIFGEALASDTQVNDAGAVVPKLDATALQLREHSGRSLTSRTTVPERGFGIRPRRPRMRPSPPTLPIWSAMAMAASNSSQPPWICCTRSSTPA